MADVLTNLFEEFDRGRLSRRRLLRALGVAAVMRPAAALAQGQCGGARASLPECDPTPAKLPFAATGWKTVLLDHFSVQVADVEKEAAYYAALMNWKVRSFDGQRAMLDIGDWGGLEIRGGYQPPAGGGGGGRARQAAFDSFCWGIEPWDAKTVEAELRKRGLNPVAESSGRDFQSFRIKDADGFNLQISNGNRRNRRQGPANGKLSVPAPFESTSWKTVWLDHISFETSNYKEQAAFYHALLGWKLDKDEGSQNSAQIGDMGGIIIRRGGGGGRGNAAAAGAPAGAPTPAAPPARRASIGHISFGIEGFDPDAVKAELDKRGLNARVDTGGNGDIHTARYKSYHTTTPNGFDLQISNVTKAE
jgi:catechol 2,3-dioxygenase-like lactoylglutathione lyase family enzyme